MTQPNHKYLNKIDYNFLLLGLLCISFIFAFYPVWRQLILTWWDKDEYSYGFFIVPISLYIAWTKRHSLTIDQASPTILEIVLLVSSLLIYIFSKLAGILTLQSISMLFFIYAGIYFLFGACAYRKLLFPIFFLFFMIPVPAQIYSVITIPLQLFVSNASVELAKFMDIPVLREGNVIHLPGYALEVVQACSGLRSMTSLILLSVLFAYFRLNTKLLRGILFFAAVPIAVFVNIIRVLMMILAFHFYNYDLTAGMIHTVFGVLIFMFALLLLFFSGKGLSTWDKSVG